MSDYRAFRLLELNIQIMRSKVEKKKKGPLSAADAYKEAVKKIAEVRASKANGIDFSNLRYLKKLPPLAGLEQVVYFSASHTLISDISEIGTLRNLVIVDIGSTRVTSLAGIETLEKLRELILSDTSVSDLTPIVGLPIQLLDCSSTQVMELNPISSLKQIKKLNVAGTGTTNLSPISGLVNLETLNAAYTEVSDLTPLENLLALEALNVSSTKVSDLSPLKNVPSLLNGVRNSKHYRAERGATFRDCPIADRTLAIISQLYNPRCTEELFRYFGETKDDNDASIAPVENVPAAASFALTSSNTITATSSPNAKPLLPFPISASDHLNRLEACRNAASDLLEDTSYGHYQLRREYCIYLERYHSRLPTLTSDGNILLADAAARTLRSLFAAEVEFLSPAFAAPLKIFLEQHIALRAFYPEVSRFYSDVQSGRVSAPLPLDAVDGFIEAIKDNTPSIFDSSVQEVLESASENVDVSIDPQNGASNTDLAPPPDPLGILEPQKARNFTVAGIINNVWQVFLKGEKIHHAVAAWVKAAKDLEPYARAVIRWLQGFYGP